MKHVERIPTYVDLDMYLNKRETNEERYRKIMILVNQFRELCSNDGSDVKSLGGFEEPKMHQPYHK